MAMLLGKTIVVTGGANGIGNACARLFASSGGASGKPVPRGKNSKAKRRRK